MDPHTDSPQNNFACPARIFSNDHEDREEGADGHLHRVGRCVADGGEEKPIAHADHT